MTKTTDLFEHLKKYGTAKGEETTPKAIVENQVKDLFSEAVLDTLTGANPVETVNSILFIKIILRPGVYPMNTDFLILSKRCLMAL